MHEALPRGPGTGEAVLVGRVFGLCLRLGLRLNAECSARAGG
ncbi:hypothetical protein [Streptomyces capparidis]